MKTIRLILALLGLPILAVAQTNFLGTTTLSSAVTTTTQNTVVLASTSGVNVPTLGGNGSYLYVDREEMEVIAFVPPGTTTNQITQVIRGVNGTAAELHQANALVWVGQADWFSGAPVGSVPAGTCTIGNLNAYPDIHVLTGDIFGCSSDGRWGYAGPSGFSSQLGNAITAVATTYTAKYYDLIIQADPTSGGFTITLPAASGLPGKVFYIVNPGTSTNTITVTTAGGCATIASSHGACRIYSTGSAWQAF